MRCNIVYDFVVVSLDCIEAPHSIKGLPAAQKASYTAQSHHS